MTIIKTKYKCTYLSVWKNYIFIVFNFKCTFEYQPHTNILFLIIKKIEIINLYEILTKLIFFFICLCDLISLYINEMIMTLSLNSQA